MGSTAGANQGGGRRSFSYPRIQPLGTGRIKNALDVGSRPYGQNAWDGKPGGVVSVSISSLGGFGANHHLRQSLVYLNVPAMAQPEVYIGEAAELFAENGHLTNDSTREFLKNFIMTFEKWVVTHAKALQPVA